MLSEPLAVTLGALVNCTSVGELQESGRALTERLDPSVGNSTVSPLARRFSEDRAAQGRNHGEGTFPTGQAFQHPHSASIRGMVPAVEEVSACHEPFRREVLIRAFVVSLLGAATLTAGVVLIRLRRRARTAGPLYAPAGGTTTHTVSLERLRELGL